MSCKIYALSEHENITWLSVLGPVWLPQGGWRIQPSLITITVYLIAKQEPSKSGRARVAVYTTSRSRSESWTKLHDTINIVTEIGLKLQLTLVWLLRVFCKSLTSLIFWVSMAWFLVALSSASLAFSSASRTFCSKLSIPYSQIESILF